MIILVVSFFLRRGVNRRIQNTDHRYKARKVINLSVYVLIVVLVVFVYGDKLGNAGVAIGVIAAGIAFALQEVIMSFAGWVYIMTGNVVSVGNRVRVGDVKGDIIDIGVMTTTIMEVGDWIKGDQYNGCIVKLSNNYVFRHSVHNYSLEFPFLWDEVLVPIRLESDHHKARELFQKVIDEICGEYARKSKARWETLKTKYLVEEAKVDPTVSLQFDENWITFTLRYPVEYNRRRSTKDAIYSRLLDEIANYDDIIMIATSTLEVTNVTDSKE